MASPSCWPVIGIPALVDIDRQSRPRAFSRVDRRTHCAAIVRALSLTKGEVQNAQRRAAIGTSLRHSGHFFVVGSGATSPRRIRARIVFIGSTIKKYTAAAIRMNETSALIKSPIGNLLPLT